MIPRNIYPVMVAHYIKTFLPTLINWSSSHVNTIFEIKTWGHGTRFWEKWACCLFQIWQNSHSYNMGVCGKIGTWWHISVCIIWEKIKLFFFHAYMLCPNKKKLFSKKKIWCHRNYFLNYMSLNIKIYVKLPYLGQSSRSRKVTFVIKTSFVLQK